VAREETGRHEGYQNRSCRNPEGCQDVISSVMGGEHSDEIWNPIHRIKQLRLAAPLQTWACVACHSHMPSCAIAITSRSRCSVMVLEAMLPLLCPSGLYQSTLVTSSGHES
jgi:hypothetical protein